MKKGNYILILTMIFAVVLTACSGEAEPLANGLQELNPTAVIETITGGDEALTIDYRDALPLEMQLAIGTLQLENTNLAVTAEQAQTLLPYWRVLQSLVQSDNTADAELDAVIKQIHKGMNGEQIAAIAAMELTEDKLQTMLDDGSINFGFGRGQSGSEAGSGGGFRPGGGPGGGPPGGGFPGGGPGGFGGDPGAFATQQAEMEASGENPMTVMMERMSSNMVIRLLETKTGEASTRGPGGIGATFGVVSELAGLSEEELDAALAEGQTLGEVLEANGVSLDEAREALKEEMADMPLPGDQDLDSWIDGLLSGSFGGERRPPADQ